MCSNQRVMMHPPLLPQEGGNQFSKKWACQGGEPAKEPSPCLLPVLVIGLDGSFALK